MTGPYPNDVTTGGAALREASLRMLEFHLVLDRLAGYATFPPARELALALEPSQDPAEVVRRQEETLEARRVFESAIDLPLGDARDIRGALQRALLGGVLTGEELIEVNETLKAARTVRAALLRRTDAPVLVSLAQGLPVMRELERALEAAIGPAGDVLDGASPYLRDLRVEARTAYQRLMDYMERTERRMLRSNVLQEPIITQRNGRMVLLVRTEMRQRLPGIVHDLSDSGASLFVEPMGAVGMGNHWRETRLAQEREEQRVLRDLSSWVEAASRDLENGLRLLARLDLAMAKARYALATSAVAPVVVEGSSPLLDLVDVRHPLLAGEAVPITIAMGEGSRVMLITGPNAGGKTVALKTVGLVSLMAQAGLHVPARHANINVFDGVYVDIGDQQSIQRSLSTFSSHVETMKGIMEVATGRSLVLIDELGTSTDPEEGAALAKAVLQHFCSQGTAMVATSHHREVATFVQEEPGMTNASVELDPSTLDPTFRLSVGLPGRSYALTIASRLGLKGEVVERARSLLSPAHRTAESLVAQLQEERRLAQEARWAAEIALSRAEANTAELDAQLAQVEDSKALLVEEARHRVGQMAEELQRRLREAEKAMERPPPPTSKVVQTSAPPPPLKQARKEVAAVRRELRAPEWRPPPSARGDWISRIRPGDRVYLRGMPAPVEIITPPDEGGTTEVLLGTMRARLPVHQLDRPAPTHPATSGKGVFYARPKHKKAESELDLRGVRVEDGLDRVDSFLNDGTMAGLSSVRIIHGTGTGALRAAIREFLAHHPLVKSVNRDEGSVADGVTVVELA